MKMSIPEDSVRPSCVARQKSDEPGLGNSWVGGLRLLICGVVGNAIAAVDNFVAEGKDIFTNYQNSPWHLGFLDDREREGLR